MAKQIAGVALKQSIKRTPPSQTRDKWDKPNNAEHPPHGPIIAMPTATRTTPTNNPCPATPIAYIHFKNGHDPSCQQASGNRSIYGRTFLIQSWLGAPNIWTKGRFVDTFVNKIFAASLGDL
jgi:hypothetical protein